MPVNEDRSISVPEGQLPQYDSRPRQAGRDPDEKAMIWWAVVFTGLAAYASIVISIAVYATD